MDLDITNHHAAAAVIISELLTKLLFECEVMSDETKKILDTVMLQTGVFANEEEEVKLARGIIKRAVKILQN